VRAFRREVSRRGNAEDVARWTQVWWLRVVDVEPEPIFVASYVFLPKDARQRSWLITDPLGLGVSDVLRPGVTKLAKEGKHGLAELLEKVAGQAWHVDEGDLALYLAEATKAATERVQRRLGDAAKLLPADVLARLADADVRLEGAQTAKPIEDFLGNAYTALESVFGWMVSLYPDPSLFSALGHNAPENAPLLRRGVAEQVGFAASPRTLPLLSVTRGVREGSHLLRQQDPPWPTGGSPSRGAAQRRAPTRNSLGAREPDALEFFARSADSGSTPRTIPPPSRPPRSRSRCGTACSRSSGRLSVLVRLTWRAGTSEPSWGADLLLRVRAQRSRQPRLSRALRAP
jgi:hypothetical protein